MTLIKLAGKLFFFDYHNMLCIRMRYFESELLCFFVLIFLLRFFLVFLQPILFALFINELY